MANPSDTARLLELVSQKVDLSRHSFAGVCLVKLWLQNADLRGIDLKGANLAEARFNHCDLTGANLEDADLSRATFEHCQLVNVELRGADLGGCYLRDVSLTGARVRGACFQNARLAWDVAFSEDQFVHDGGLGQAARTLESSRARFRSEAVVHLDKEPAYLSIERKARIRYVASHDRLTLGQEAPDVLQALIHLANLWGHGRLDPDSVTVRLHAKNALKDRELAEVARAAWCEAFAVAVPARPVVFTPFRPDKQKREDFLAMLKEGVSGVERWNACEQERIELRNFRKVDLSGLNLAGAKFNRLDLGGARFDGADLRGTSFSVWAETVERGQRALRTGKKCSLTDASFKGADLREAHLGLCQALRACFDGARLEKAKLSQNNFTGASFRDADLRGASLWGSNLRGADLTGARLEGTNLRGITLDDNTRFPDGFLIQPPFKWKGKGPAPTAEAP